MLPTRICDDKCHFLHHTGSQVGVERALARDFTFLTANMTNPDDFEPNELARAGTGQTQRARWATRRMTVKSSNKKRMHLLSRMQNARSSSDEKEERRRSDGQTPEPTDSKNEAPEETAEPNEEENGGRTLYFNQPLPDDMLDEEGMPAATYTRNKIRTARYTPLSFVPKNLWNQFHNIANIFFLFLVILVVSGIGTDFVRLYMINTA